MGTNCLIRCGVVLLVADDQRSYFMTNGHLSPMGVRLSFVRGSSVLRPQLAALSISQYSGSSVSPTWRSASYGGLVYPSSVVCYARCILIIWESRFPYLATELTKGGPTKNGPIKWNPACTEAFLQMKELIAKDTILTYPYFSKSSRSTQTHRTCNWVQ